MQCIDLGDLESRVFSIVYYPDNSTNIVVLSIFVEALNADEQ